jgi:hypothetical protein
MWHGVANLVAKKLAHLDARLIDRNAIHQRVRARQIDILEHAGRMHGLLRALPADELSARIDQHGFARLDVAQELEAERINRHALRRDKILHALWRFVTTDHQRTNTVGIAEGQQAIAGNHRHHGVSPLDTLVHAGHRLEDDLGIDLIFRRSSLQLVGQYVEQYLGIRVGVHVPQVLQEHVALQLLGIRQVAVVREHQAERRIDVKRLRLSGIPCRTRRRIAAMGDAPVADQAAHVAGTEHIAHQARALVHVKTPALRRGDAGRILPAMLEHLQAVI